MREHRVTLPKLALIAFTRGLAGFGAGLLLASRIDKRPRRWLGFSMLAAGALSTVPIAIMMFRKSEILPNGKRPQQSATAHA